MARVVHWQLAKRRAGTHKTKGISDISGTTKKPWRQKGTGRARAGTTRAAQWTGGGMAFALAPRSYGGKVNRKVRKSALRAALTLHAKRGSLAVISDGGFDGPSTKQAAAFLQAWGASTPLLVVAQPDEERTVKSFRNLARVLVLEPSEVEVAAVVWARSLLATEAALQRVQEVALP